MMMGEAKISETAETRLDRNDNNFTALNDSGKKKKKKESKNLQTTTYVPNGFVCMHVRCYSARARTHDKASLARCESSVLI